MGDRLNAISLFSGIGGFELGIGDYCKTVLYCEADTHAQAVLLSRMADGAIDIAPISTDVREITKEFVDIPVDIIYGGFPCTDISVAGKGVGLDGKHSGLFFEIVRLADEIKPTFLFLENVPAIRTRGLDRVIGELTQIGYDIRWCMLSASDVGAKHRRERWFLLAARREHLMAYTQSDDGRRRLSDLSCQDAAQSRSEEQYQDKTRESCNSSQDTGLLADTNEGGLQAQGSEQPSAGTSREGGEKGSGDNRTAQSDMGWLLLDGVSIRVGENIKCWSELDETSEIDDSELEKVWEVYGNSTVDWACRPSLYQFALADNLRQKIYTHKSQEDGDIFESGFLLREIKYCTQKNIDAITLLDTMRVLSYYLSPQTGRHCKLGTQIAMSYLWYSLVQIRAMLTECNTLTDAWNHLSIEWKESIILGVWFREPPIPRVTDNKDQRVERIKRLGNAVVPLQVRTAFEYLMGIKTYPIPRQDDGIDYEEW